MSNGVRHVPLGVANGADAHPGTGRGNFYKIALIAALLCMWEKFPFILFSSNELFGNQLYSLFTLAAFSIAMARLVMGKFRLDFWTVVPLLFFVYCFALSLLYNKFISYQPASTWLIAIYTVSPIVLIFALKVFNCKLEHALAALVWTGLLASTLIMFVDITNSDLLNYYIRGSWFGTDRRIVFFKLESTLALIISAHAFVISTRLKGRLFHALVVFFTGYNVIVLSESRLAIAAVLLSFLLSWVFLLKFKAKFFYGMAGGCVALMLLPFVVDRYLSDFRGFEALASTDTSASYRSLEMEYFKQHFINTGNLGFGFMSGNPEYNNIIAFAKNKAGYNYGTGSFGMMLDDIGLLAALYQYGYPGFMFAIGMTAAMIFAMFRLARSNVLYVPVGGISLLILSYMLSPLPMNFFTIFYSAHIGGLLWFIAAEAAYTYKRTVIPPVKAASHSNMGYKVLATGARSG